MPTTPVESCKYPRSAEQTDTDPTKSWSNVPDGVQTASDASESSCGNELRSQTEVLYLYNFQFTIPTEATNLSLTVNIRHKKAGGRASIYYSLGQYDANSNQFFNRDGSYPFFSDNSYSDDSRVHRGGLWEYGEINSTRFCIAIWAFAHDGGAYSIVSYLDEVEICANYDQPAADDFVPVTATPITWEGPGDPPDPPVVSFIEYGIHRKYKPTGFDDAVNGKICTRSGLWFPAHKLVYRGGEPFGVDYDPGP